MGLLEQLGGVQQRLGRDAADVEAGAAQRLAALDAGGLQPQLGGADRRHIAAGTGADHDQVEVSLCHFISFVPRRRPGPSCGGRGWTPAFAGN